MKNYQVQSEHKHTQNHFKHLRWSVFVQTVNILNSLPGYAKNSTLDVWRGSKYASAAKQVRFNVCRKNSRRRYLKYKSTWCVFWNISMTLAGVWLRNLRFENLWISSVQQNVRSTNSKVQVALSSWFFASRSSVTLIIFKTCFKNEASVTLP